jgi:hypothetical protein
MGGIPEQQVSRLTIRDEQWQAATGSATIIATGFAIFTLSNFPPTQPFKLVVMFATLIDIMTTLLVLPLLSGARWGTGSKAHAGSASNGKHLIVFRHSART